MKLHTLPKIIQRRQKRVGRGAGSGKGKTSGRGTKGQGARTSVKLLFEGGQVPLIKKLPLLRGKGTNKPVGKKPYIINVKYLNILPNKSIVDIQSLKKHNLISEDFTDLNIKILGMGELKKSLTVKLKCSKIAKEKIIKVGGKVE
ncbi:50S ribosomal protein L15 [Candidatus Gottesmanbacteria bacterium]|nr:50S ribosomal protein L15 [Candidatus Gottesmanbacteria bacterium]